MRLVKQEVISSSWGGVENRRVRWLPLSVSTAVLLLVVAGPLQPLFGTSTPGGGDQDDDCTPSCKEKCCGKKEYEDCPGQPRATTCEPVDLRYGAVLERATDLLIPGPGFDWMTGRSYSSRWTGGSTYGNLWLSSDADSYLVMEGSDVSLLVNVSSKRTFTASGSPPIYSASETSDLRLTHDSTEDEFILTDKKANLKYVFNDFTITATAARGKIKEQSSLQWSSQDKIGALYAYDGSGSLTQVTTAEGQDYNIVFTYSGTSIAKIEVKDVDSNVLEQVEYTYYDDVTNPSSDIGSSGDLVQVKVSRRATTDTTSLSVVRYTQYRYTSGSKLKAVFEDDAINRVITSDAGISSPDDILTKADAYGTPVISGLSSRSFEYYTSNTSTANIVTPFSPSGENLNTTYGGSEATEADMVKSETIGGGCTSCGSSDGGIKRSYFYLDLDQGVTLDQNEVVRIVVEDTEDSNGTARYRTVYGLSDTGRLLRKAFVEDPVGSPSYWCESFKMATTGKSARLGEERMPSAHAVTTAAHFRSFLDPYDSEGASWTNDTNTLNASGGLINVYDYSSDGMRTDHKVKKGRAGTEYYVAAWDYGDGDGDSSGDDYDNNTLLVATYDYPVKTTTRTSGKKTSYSYTFWDGDDREVKTKTTTLPVISSGQNGSGVATTLVEYYGSLGKLRWAKDGEGYISYYSYNPITGDMAYEISDVDPASPGLDVTSGSGDNWSAWAVGGADTNKPSRDSGLPTALGLVEKTYYDDQGRMTQTIDRNGAEHFTVYEDDRTIRFRQWDSGGNETLMPILITQFNKGGQVEQSISVKAGYASISTATSGAPTGFSVEPSQSDYVRWTRNTYDDDNGRLRYVDRYHDIPSSGNGTLSANYYREISNYDATGRPEYLVRVVSGSSATDRKEQITQNVYDVHGRVVEVRQGVSGDSAANNHSMTDAYNTYPTLRIIAQVEYDDGGVGDGYVTKVKQFHGTGANDYTGVNRKVTYRGHRRGGEPFYMNGSTETLYGPYVVEDVNWKGQAVCVSSYDAAPTWGTVLAGDGYTDYASSSATNRRTREGYSYDDLGRIYQTQTYDISAATGTGGNNLAENMFYDRNNREVAAARDHGAGLETAYDGAGRSYQTRTVLSLATTKYVSGAFQYRLPSPHPALSSMSGGDDGVLVLNHTVFGPAGTTEAHSFGDNHDDAASASRGIDLTNNDDYVRQSIYSWYNSAGQLKAVADYGSGDTTTGAGTWKYSAVPTLSPSSPTASDELKRVTLIEYNSDTGRSETITQPSGSKVKTIYDDLGRETYVIHNYVDFDSGTESGTGDSSDKSKDRVNKSVYNGIGQLQSVVAMDANADGNLSDNQVTTMLYEDPVNSAWRTSIIFPESSDTTSSGTDQVKMSYNTDGSLSQRTDQRETVIQFTYTNKRQLELSKVTTLGGSTDGHVRAIKRAYGDLGQLETLTSYANSDATGTVRNEVQLSYNDLRQLTDIHQSHEGAVSTPATPKVQYDYDSTTDGTSYSRQHRKESVTYPAGTAIFFDYDTANADYPSNRLSRIYNLREANSSGTVLAQYSLSATEHLSVVDYPVIDVKLDYSQGTSGTYEGMDRFGRVKDHYWEGYNSTADVDRFHYGYDYSSSRTYRDIDSAIYATDDQDQTYAHDGLDRVKAFKEGTLSGGSIAGTPTKERDWVLQRSGNWSNFTEVSNSTTNLSQSRTVNAANEITNVTETVGPSWATPAYDASGNMESIPSPTALTTTYTATYDAWNRLVKLSSGANTVAEYEYDAGGKRILKHVYSGGALDYTLHYYYDEFWRVLEVRKETSGTEDEDPLETYVWHPYYIDSLLLRDYDSNTDGTSERHYYMQDANANVTAITDNAGTVLERYHYTPYGEIAVLDPDFSADADNTSDVANSTAYTGRLFDRETGLYYYRNRYYHPQVGVFITRDPLGYVNDSFDQYEYVSSAPLSSQDPLGLKGRRNICKNRPALPPRVVFANKKFKIDKPGMSISAKKVMYRTIPHWEIVAQPSYANCGSKSPVKKTYSFESKSGVKLGRFLEEGGGPAFDFGWIKGEIEQMTTQNFSKDTSRTVKITVAVVVPGCTKVTVQRSQKVIRHTVTGEGTVYRPGTRNPFTRFNFNYYEDEYTLVNHTCIVQEKCKGCP
ncbi:tRNA3(Ser)-specific nuclease WapA precursor [Symmachiella dynata]|uniref:tRNA3(Ser)-specific nuclease WapA n=1 Tax=Symmachiella dynata TaxID=2527995 RepID=A0A517ZPY7_9PLAN|nr:RHS repeat-associated core domain-containing protein [Symmachiella dynata]QDU44544.1 tRNA3(Ser)-specific nuclease WapA precursor [Symmachiella dynata]